MRKTCSKVLLQHCSAVLSLLLPSEALVARLRSLDAAAGASWPPHWMQPASDRTRWRSDGSHERGDGSSVVSSVTRLGMSNTITQGCSSAPGPPCMGACTTVRRQTDAAPTFKLVSCVSAAIALWHPMGYSSQFTCCTCRVRTWRHSLRTSLQAALRAHALPRSCSV